MTDKRTFVISWLLGSDKWAARFASEVQQDTAERHRPERGGYGAGKK